MKTQQHHCFLYLILSLTLAGACKGPEPLPPNILLICVDDLRPELKSFGAEHILSPNIDRLAAKGMAFTRHYVNAPSCGPSRYTLLTGTFGPPGNNALFLRREKLLRQPESIYPSMPAWFRQQGYSTVSVGKVSHHPGGMGGFDWNDSTFLEMPDSWDRSLMPSGLWDHPRGAMHGLAYGEIRIHRRDMDVFQASPGKDHIYPDGAISQQAVVQLQELTAANKPFFMAVGLIRPHLPFGAPERYLQAYQRVEFPAVPHPEKPEGRTTWHNSGEFMGYNRWGKDPNLDSEFAEDVRRHYAAAVSYADAQVGKILSELERTGADKNTIVVLWGDHGWHLGEHGIWGKHSLFEEALRSPLIIYYPGMEQSGSKTAAVVESLDIFPTLCELTGIETPSFVQGNSLKNILQQPGAMGSQAVAYTSSASTIRTDAHRLILHNDGYMELYDHTSREAETRNLAGVQPWVAEDLKQLLLSRLSKAVKE